MKKLAMIIGGGLLVNSSMVFSLDAETAWQILPKDKQELFKKKAAEMGFDLSTEEGRQEFLEAMKQRRLA